MESWIYWSNFFLWFEILWNVVTITMRCNRSNWPPPKISKLKWMHRNLSLRCRCGAENCSVVEIEGKLVNPLSCSRPIKSTWSTRCSVRMWFMWLLGYFIKMYIRCSNVTVGRRSVFMIFISSPSIGQWRLLEHPLLQAMVTGRSGSCSPARLYVINCHRHGWDPCPISYPCPFPYPRPYPNPYPVAVSGEDTVSDRCDRCGS